MVATSTEQRQALTPYLALAIEQLKNGTFPIDSEEQIEQLVKDAEQAGILVELQEQSTGAKILGLKIGEHYLPITDTKKNCFLLLSNQSEHHHAPLRFTTLSKDSSGSIVTSDLTSLDYQRQKEAEWFGGFIRNEAKGVERLSGVQEGVGKALGEWGGFAANLAKYAAITAGVVVLGVIATGSGGAVLAAIGSAVWGSIMGGTALGAVGGAIGTAFQATAAFVLGAGALGAGGAYINKWREQQGKSRLPTVFELLNPSLALERSRAIKELDRAMQKGKTASGMQFTPVQQELAEPVVANIPKNTETVETEDTLEIEKAHPDYALTVKDGGAVPEGLQDILSKNSDADSYYNVEETRLTDLVAMGSDAEKRVETAPHWNTLMYPGFTPEQIKDRVNQATTSITAVVGLESLKNNTLTGDAKFEALAALGEELEKHLAACIVGKEGAAVKQPMLVGDMGIAVADLLGDNANELVLQAAAAYTMKKELGSDREPIDVATQYYSESRLNTAPADIRSKFSDAIIDLANLHNSSITKAGIESTFNVLYADFSARHPA